MRSPWLLGDVAWDELLVKRAVIWLSLLAGRGVLRLTGSDYADNHLQVRLPAAHLGHPALGSAACAAKGSASRAPQQGQGTIKCHKTVIASNNCTRGEPCVGRCAPEQALLVEHGPAQALNERVYTALQGTITQHPGSMQVHLPYLTPH